MPTRSAHLHFLRLRTRGRRGGALGRGAYPSQPCRRALYAAPLKKRSAGPERPLRCHEQSSVSGVSRGPRGAMGGSSQIGRVIQRDNSEHRNRQPRRAGDHAPAIEPGPWPRASLHPVPRGRAARGRRKTTLPRAPREAEGGMKSRTLPTSIHEVRTHRGSEWLRRRSVTPTANSRHHDESRDARATCAELRSGCATATTLCHWHPL